MILRFRSSEMILFLLISGKIDHREIHSKYRGHGCIKLVRVSIFPFVVHIAPCDMGHVLFSKFNFVCGGVSLLTHLYTYILYLTSGLILVSQVLIFDYKRYIVPQHHLNYNTTTIRILVSSIP